MDTIELLDVAEKELFNPLSELDVIRTKLNSTKSNQDNNRVHFTSDELNLLPIHDAKKYSVSLIGGYEISEKMMQSFGALCSKEHNFNSICSNLDSGEKSFRLILRDCSNIIGFCQFTMIETIILVDWLFIQAEERRKALGGCLLSILQDFGKILFSKTIPIVIQLTRMDIDRSTSTFLTKYFFSEPRNYNDVLIVNKIVEKNFHSMVEDKVYYIGRIPMILLFDNDMDLFPIDSWSKIVDIVKKLCFESNDMINNNKVYTDAEKYCRIILLGKLDYKLWKESLIVKWINNDDIDDEKRSISGSLNIVKEFLDVSVEEKRPVLNYEIPPEENWLKLASKVFYKRHDEYFRFQTCLALFSFFLSRAVKNETFLDKYNKEFKQSFSNSIRWIQDNNMTTKNSSLSNDFVILSRLYLNGEIPFTMYDFLVLAKFMNYNTILLEPFLFHVDAKNPITVNDQKKVLWSLKRNINIASTNKQNNTLIIINLSGQTYVLSISLNKISIKKGNDIARKQFQENEKSYNHYKNLEARHPNCESFIKFEKELNRYVPVIDDNNFVTETFPYSKWLSTPHQFHVKNDLVSATIPTDFYDAVNATECLKLFSKYVNANLEHIKMIDVKNDCVHQDKWSFKKLVEYFQRPKRDRIYNQVSYEISGIEQLLSIIQAPKFVKEVDWIDVAWNIPKHKRFPNIQRYMITSVKYCYMDFHLDMNGSSVWYHIVQGKKVICMIKPTKENLQLFKDWTIRKQQNKKRHTTYESFLSLVHDTSDIMFVEAGKGHTTIIPSGYIHAVYTSTDSIVFGGNFFHSNSIPMQMQITNMEDLMKVDSSGRCPMFSTLCLFAVDYIFKKIFTGTAIDEEEMYFYDLIHFCRSCLGKKSRHYYYLQADVRKQICSYHAVNDIKTYLFHAEHLINYVTDTQSKCFKDKMNAVRFLYIRYTQIMKMYKLNEDDLIRFLEKYVVVHFDKTGYTAIFVCPVDGELSKSVPLIDVNANPIYYRINQTTVPLKDYNQEDIVLQEIHNNDSILFFFSTSEEAIKAALLFRFDCLNYRYREEFLITKSENIMYPDNLRYCKINPYGADQGLFTIPDVEDLKSIEKELKLLIDDVNANISNENKICSEKGFNLEAATKENVSVEHLETRKVDNEKDKENENEPVNKIGENLDVAKVDTVNDQNVDNVRNDDVTNADNEDDKKGGHVDNVEEKENPKRKHRESTINDEVNEQVNDNGEILDVANVDTVNVTNVDNVGTVDVTNNYNEQDKENEHVDNDEKKENQKRKDHDMINEQMNNNDENHEQVNDNDENPDVPKVDTVNITNVDNVGTVDVTNADNEEDKKNEHEMTQNPSFNEEENNEVDPNKDSNIELTDRNTDILVNKDNNASIHKDNNVSINLSDENNIEVVNEHNDPRQIAINRLEDNNGNDDTTISEESKLTTISLDQSKSNSMRINKKRVPTFQKKKVKKSRTQIYYEEKHWMLTFPFLGGLEIESCTSDLEYVQFENLDRTAEVILQCQNSWSPNITPAVKLDLPELRRICNLNDGYINDRIVNFWGLWISRIFEKDLIPFYICSASFYTLLTKDNKFNYDLVRSKISCDIFEKHIIMIPLLVGSYNWQLCVIFNPSFILEPSKKSRLRKYGQSIKFDIQIFDSSEILFNATNNSLRKSNRDRIISNILEWLKYEWVNKKIMRSTDETIYDNIFKEIKKRPVFSYAHKLEPNEHGIYVCSIIYNVVHYYLQLDGPTIQYMLNMDELENNINKVVTPTTVSGLRRQLLYLVKELSHLQRRGKAKDVDDQKLDDYVAMSHITLHNEAGTPLWLNRITTIKKFSKIRDQLTLLSFDNMNKLSIVDKVLNKNNLDNGDKAQFVETVVNKGFIHPNVIEDYNVYNNDEISIICFANDFKEEILNYHLNSMSEEERSTFNEKEWLSFLYGKVRSSFEEAKKLMLTQHLSVIEELQEEIIKEYNIVSRKKAMAISLGNDPNKVSCRKYHDLVTQLILLLDYITETPFLHPADSIIAVRKTSDVMYELVIDQSKIHLQGVENKIIVKEADLEFMMENFTQPFIEEINRQYIVSFDDKKWIVQKEIDDSINVITLDNIDAIKENIHHGVYRTLRRKRVDDNNFIKIMYVRASVKLTPSPTDPYMILKQNYEWHFFCVNVDINNFHIYEQISEMTLGEVVSSAVIANWKIECLVLFQNIRDGLIDNEMSTDDKLDIDYDNLRDKRGNVEDINSFYFKTSEDEFYITLTDEQLCKFYYDKKNNIFYGLGAENYIEQEKHEVSREWLLQNFGEKLVDHLETTGEMESKVRFHEVCPGNIVAIDPKFINPSNPVIMYQQKEEKTCAFYSLASILYHLNHKESAKLMVAKQKEFEESLGDKVLIQNKLDGVKNELRFSKKRKRNKKMRPVDEILRPMIYLDWLEFIGYYMKGTITEHHYMMKKLSPTFDFKKHYYNMLDNEFILGALRADDNAQSHAICISREYIFDTNATHAISFSFEALDACCPPGFVCIYKGLYFHTRQNLPEHWLG